MFLQSAVLLCFLLCHAIATPLLDEDSKVEKKDKSSYNFCFVNGRVYQHGEVFTLPGSSRCIKYRCEFGAHQILEEGCESFSGRCYAVNSRFEENCVTYTCVRTTPGDNMFYYQTQPTGSQKCKDYYGRCRLPGEVFPYTINGKLYDKCTCRPNGSNVYYQCSY